MKKILVALAFAVSVQAQAQSQTSLPKGTLDLLKGSVNQYLLFAHGALSGAFPGGSTTPVPEKTVCAMVGAAHVSLLTLASLSYTDQQISDLIQMLPVDKIVELKTSVAAGAKACGNLF